MLIIQTINNMYLLKKYLKTFDVNGQRKSRPLRVIGSVYDVNSTSLIQPSLIKRSLTLNTYPLIPLHVS